MYYSLSKVSLTEAVSRQIVARHFGPGVQLRAFQELHEGFFNAAAELELSNGITCVLKAAPPPHVAVLKYERDIMRAEVESLRLVRERTSLPVPEIYGYDSSHELLPGDYFLMERLPGVALHGIKKDLPEAAQAEIEREMGRMARALSEITNDRFGLWAQPSAPGVSWRETFAKMVADLLEDGQALDVPLPMPYEAIDAIIERHLPALDEVTVPGLVHWDIWDGNVFVDPQTCKVTGLIDFERVMWADPLIEQLFGWQKSDSNFAQGYGKAMPVTEAEITRRLLYNTHLWLIMVIECYYRKYTNNQETWVRPLLEQVLNTLKERS